MSKKQILADSMRKARWFSSVPESFVRCIEHADDILCECRPAPAQIAMDKVYTILVGVKRYQIKVSKAFATGSRQHKVECISL